MTTILASAIVLELSLGQSGIALPLTAMACLYFAVTYPKSFSLPYYLTACAILDLGFGRLFPVSILSLIMILPFASTWRIAGNTSAPMHQVIPGAVAGLATFITSTIYSASRLAVLNCPHVFLSPFLAVEHILFTSICFPFAVVFLDKLAKKLALRRYRSSNRFQSMLDYENGLKN